LLDFSTRSGPAVADYCDIYFLKDEPWLEIKMSSLEQCKRDGVIPWIRSGASQAVADAEKLGMQIIIGPNCVFADSNNPHLNDFELNSPAVLKLLMLDETNIDLAKGFAKYPDRIRRVSHFMRPELYEKPFFYEHDWDVFFLAKTSMNTLLRVSYLNHTALHNGWYTFDELVYKAQHSKICFHACDYENYGMAIHEISLLGCPIVYDHRGMKPGTVGEGMGVQVSSVVTDDLKELENAIEKAMAMDRKKVWEASHEFQSPTRIKEIYRKAILE
jgi:hypothetical protein